MPRKKKSGSDRPKPQQMRGKPPATGNRRLGEQTRRILGKHYANRYRVR